MRFMGDRQILCGGGSRRKSKKWSDDGGPRFVSVYVLRKLNWL